MPNVPRAFPFLSLILAACAHHGAGPRGDLASGEGASSGSPSGSPSASNGDGLLRAPSDPPPPPTDDARLWRLSQQGGIGAYGPWREQAKEEIHAGSVVRVAAMRCTSTSRRVGSGGTEPVAVSRDGMPDVTLHASCAPSPLPDTELTRRLRACFRVETAAPSRDALAAMKASLEAQQGSAWPTVDDPDGSSGATKPLRFVVATIARSWEEPEAVEVERIGCGNHVGRPCDPVGVISRPRGKWSVKSSSDVVASGPGGAVFGASSGATIFPRVSVASGTFLLPYDRATSQPHPALTPPKSVYADKNPTRATSAWQLASLEKNDRPPEPDLRAAFLLDRAQLAYALGDAAKALAADTELRSEIAARPPRDPALRRALDVAIPALDKLASGAYSITDPCTGKR